MNLSIVDILFVVTAGILVFNGLKNGAIFSIIHLLGIPIALFVAVFFGERFTAILANSGLPATPLISYIILFGGTIAVLHVLGTIIRSFFRSVPILGALDPLLGGILGFVEAWIIWLLLLIVLGNFLKSVQDGTSSVHIQFDQLKAWYDFYNQAISDSVFARINNFVLQQLPNLPQPPK